MEKKIAREQRQLSRKKKGSRGYEKQRVKVAKVYEYLRNYRLDFLRKMSKQILDRYDVVVVEDIDLAGMAKRGKRRRFGKSIDRLAFGKLRDILRTSTEQQGKLYVTADKWFPSSQLCSVCGYRNRGTKDLSLRKWECPECQTIHDRDTNAAQNLVNLYLHNLSTGASPGSYADGDLIATLSIKASGKSNRRTRKSCRTIDPTSPLTN